MGAQNVEMSVLDAYYVVEIPTVMLVIMWQNVTAEMAITKMRKDRVAKLNVNLTSIVRKINSAKAICVKLPV